MAGVIVASTCHPDVLDALLAFLRNWNDAPFSWREHHCGHLPCAWVEHIELARPAMPKVSNQIGAALQVLRAGGLVSSITLAIGREPLANMADLCVGDVVAFAPGVAAPGLVGCMGVVLSPELAVVSAGPLSHLVPVSSACAGWWVAR